MKAAETQIRTKTAKSGIKRITEIEELTLVLNILVLYQCRPAAPPPGDPQSLNTPLFRVVLKQHNGFLRIALIVMHITCINFQVQLRTKMPLRYLYRYYTNMTWKKSKGIFSFA